MFPSQCLQASFQSDARTIAVYENILGPRAALYRTVNGFWTQGHGRNTPPQDVELRKTTKPLSSWLPCLLAC